MNIILMMCSKCEILISLLLDIIMKIKKIIKDIEKYIQIIKIMKIIIIKIVIIEIMIIIENEENIPIKGNIIINTKEEGIIMIAEDTTIIIIMKIMNIIIKDTKVEVVVKKGI